MTCETFQLPDGTVGIACHRGRKPKRCPCGRPAAFLCDHELRSGKTCDAPLCDRCTASPAPGKDLCPRHAPAQQGLPL